MKSCERLPYLWIIITSAIAVLMLGYSAAWLLAPGGRGLSALYYANPEWQGEMALAAIEMDISSETLTRRRQQLPHNRFSVEWTGYVDIPVSDGYTFFTTSDDGSWLFLDETLVVDNGGAHGAQEAQGTLFLKRGIHRIRVRYFQVGGYFKLAVSWMTATDPKAPLSALALFPATNSAVCLRLYKVLNAVLPFLTIGIGGLLLGIGLFASQDQARQIVGVCFIVLLLLGLFLFDDYGLSWDEPIQRQLGELNVNYMFDGDRELFADAHQNERYYGPAFEIVLILLEKALGLEDSRQIYLMRHLVTFLLFYASVAAFYLLCRQHFGSWRIGLSGSILLVASPRIFAHAFYNSKDLPFLSAFLISMYTLLKVLERQSWHWTLLHALVCGVLIDIRIVGVLMLAFTALGLFGEILAAPRSFKKPVQCFALFLLFLIPVVIAGFPVLWEDPLLRFGQAWHKMRSYPWLAEVLYFGRFIPAPELPWHYLPVWFGITTPLLYLGGGVLGVLITIAKWARHPLHRLRTRRTRFEVLVLLWFFLPVCAVIILNSVIYDSWRHLFFVYPAWLFLALIGLETLWRQLGRLRHHTLQRLARFACIALFFLCIGHIVYVMIRTHPYQQVYFNRLAGADMTDIAQHFEMDYWGLSFREGLEYIAHHDSRPQIRVHAVQEVGQLNAAILNPEDRARLLFVANPNEAEYVLTNFRWQKQPLPYSQIFYRITVGNAAILDVYKRL